MDKRLPERGLRVLEGVFSVRDRQDTHVKINGWTSR